MKTIKSTYNFNDDDIAKLEKIARDFNESQKNSPLVSTGVTGNNTNSIANGGISYVDVDYGWTWIKMTFTNTEMKMILVEAAMVGPYALYACFVGLSSITGSPIDGAIMGALGALGLPKFDSICQTIIRAYAADKGVNVEIGLDGVIPNITASVVRH
ncbi:hypothetical protein [Bacillus cereus]|uniref:hypothetical protein n=1 Tax=Bacillus cereus TaxID=1396 RepID=UPI001D0D22F1|nr:hypothetical protein [Bacillus cereus]